MEKLFTFMTEEKGATALEYGLIASLLSLTIVAALTSLGTALKATFQTLTNSL